MREHKPVKQWLNSESILHSYESGGANRRERSLVAAELARQLGGPVHEQATGRLGRRESAHGVFFLRHQLSDGTGEQHLAVKLHRNPDRAERELQALYKAQRAGVRTVLPYVDHTVSVTGVDGVVVVMERLASLQPLSLVDWGGIATPAQQGLTAAEALDWPGYVGSDRYQQQLVPLLEETSRYIAQLHQHLTHGDLQLKNIGTVSSNDYVTFDLEGAVFRDEFAADADGSYMYLLHCREDVLTYVKSLLAHGCLVHNSVEIFQQELENTIVAPYVAASGNLDILDTQLLEECEQLYRQAQAGRPDDWQLQV